MKSPLRPQDDHKPDTTQKQLINACPVLEERYRARGKPRGYKVSLTQSLSARHEILMLRAQVEVLEKRLHDLDAKWTKQLPDEYTLEAALRSACEKFELAQSKAIHNQVHDMVIQEQITFATLQTAILRAPLHSNGPEIFNALHFDTRLESAGEDVEGPQRTCTGNVTIGLESIDVTGGEDRTLVTSVFISEIPHTSVEDVYAGVLSYFESMSTSMKLHCDINVKRTRLNRDDASPSYWKSVFENEVGLPAVVNHVMCSELTSSHGIAHLDSVIDSLHPSSSNEYDINGLTLTPQKESSTGRTVSVMLRCVVVYRFNMHPDNPSLQRKFEKIRPILNGDLITTAICSYIKKKCCSRTNSRLYPMLNYPKTLATLLPRALSVNTT